MKKKNVDKTPYGTKLNVKEWSKNRNKLSDLYPSEKKFFIDKLKFSNSFLDIGCAAGNFAKIISEKTSIKNYLGIDVSENMIIKAKSLFPNYNFKKYDGKKIIYKKKFDLVFCFGTLQYCNNYKSLISQMISASKKFVIFDLRFCFDKEIIDINKSYQIIPNCSYGKLPYNFLNFTDFLKFITNLTGKKFKIEFFGYKKKPAKNVITKYKEAYMVSVLIDKTKTFQLKVNIDEKKK